MRLKKEGTLVIFVLLLVFPLVAVSPTIDNGTFVTYVDIHNTSYLEHDPIYIMSDDDFIAQGWPGSGTEADPYILEGLSITSDFECISIMFTSAWYVIRDCVFDSEAEEHNDMYDAGVYVEYGPNGIVEDCYIAHKTTAVIVFNSENFTMRNNQVFECETGLRLVSWDYPPIVANSEIINNHVSDCGYGIGVEGMSDVLVADNTVDSCWDGIILGMASNCQVDNNTLTNIDNTGVIVDDSTGCLITRNEASVGLVGISLRQSPNNQFFDNTLIGGGFIIDTWENNPEMLHHDISGNTIDGKMVGYFWGLSDTILDGTPYGQLILANCFNVIVENGVFTNVGAAVPVWFSQLCTIRNVQVVDNFLGMQIKFSNGITVEDSTIIGNVFGVSLSETDSCSIYRCDFQNNYIGALTDVYDFNVAVEDSTFTDNFGGLSLRATPSAVVRNNVFVNGSLFIDFDSWYNDHWVHTIVDNTVDGKPLGYFNWATDLTIDASTYGQIIIANSMNVAIDGGVFSGVTAAVQIGFSTGCSISNMQISDTPYGVIVSNSDQCSLVDTTFDHITKQGIYLDGNEHVVSGIEVYNFEWIDSPPMYISAFPQTSLLWGGDTFLESTWDSNFIEIYDNTIIHPIESAWGGGIRLGGYNHLVYNNTLRNCESGIDLYLGEVFDNKLYNVERAITVYGEYSKVYGNLIQGGYTGITLSDSPFIEVFENIVEDCRIGLNLQWVPDAYIHDNTFSNTTFRLDGWEVSHFSHVFENNYINGKLLGYLFDIADAIIDCGPYGAMILAYCTNVTLEDGIFEGAQIYLVYSPDCKIVNMTVSNSISYGVYLVYSQNCKVLDCTLLNNAGGIYLRSGSYSEIVGNTIIGSSYGFFSMYSRECTISENLVEDCSLYGLHLDYGADGFTIRNNTLLNNAGAAIDINLHPYFTDRYIQFGEIIGNNVTGNTGIGIDIGSRVTDLTLYSNVLVSNDLGNAQDDGMNNQWDNGVDTGNGWDDYIGTGYYFVPGAAGSVDRFPERIGGLLPPSLSSPDDFMYEYGSTENSIEWTVTADYSVSYEVMVDGNPILTGAWKPGDGAISVVIDGLEVGYHDVTIQVVGDGGEATDAVLVSVTDTTAPQWIETPQDQTIEVWQSFCYDVNATDLSGIDSYWINDTAHFIVDVDGVIVNATAMDPGVYGLEIRAYDPYGTYCSAEIQVTIEDSYDGLEAWFIEMLLQLFPLMPYSAIVAWARVLVKWYLRCRL